MSIVREGEFEFDAAARVRAQEQGRYTAHIADGWDIGGVANGGYVMSLMLHAVHAEVAPPDPVAVTGHYLAPVVAGPALVEVEVVRAGRGHATASVSLLQEGREVLRLLTTFGDLTGDRAEARAEAPPPLPPVERCVPPAPAEGTFRPPPIAERVEVRYHPGQIGFAVGQPDGSGTVSGYARLADGRAPDTLALPLFADALPPAVFNLGMLGWVPTLELSVQVRKRPARGWLRCRFRTRFLSHRYLEEDGEIWDEEGDLVALSRQLALPPRGARS